MDDIEFGFTKHCENENHIWIWFGENVLDDSPPPDNFKCKCGRVMWKDRLLTQTIEENKKVDLTKKNVV